MDSLISNGAPFDSAQGKPFIDFHCVLKRTVLVMIPLFPNIEALTSISLKQPSLIELIQNTTENPTNHSTDSQPLQIKHHQ